MLVAEVVVAFLAVVFSATGLTDALVAGLVDFSKAGSIVDDFSAPDAAGGMVLEVTSVLTTGFFSTLRGAVFVAGMIGSPLLIYEFWMGRF